MKKTGLIILFFALTLSAFPQSQEVPFTLEDRDRITRTEEKVQSLRNEMNTKFEAMYSKFEAMDSKFEAMYSKFEAIDSKFEAMDSKFEAMDTKFEALDAKFEAMDSKIETLYWGFGIMIALMLFLFGYIIWDRRTALNPIQNKTVNLEERLNKIEFAYREQAKNDQGFAEILRHAGLL